MLVEEISDHNVRKQKGCKESQKVNDNFKKVACRKKQICRIVKKLTEILKSNVQKSEKYRIVKKQLSGAEISNGGGKKNKIKRKTDA